MNPGVRQIPIKDITVHLHGEELTEALAALVIDLAMALSLELIHGHRWPQVYAEHGGMVRQNADGDPVMLWPEAPKRRADHA
jgi:hypothetical protein